MKRTLRNFTAIGLLTLAASPAWAQWVQAPNLITNRIQANATFNSSSGSREVVGDDWLASSTSPVSEIAIWGSWLNDVVDPNVTFKLSIHRDNPPGSGGIPWSRPGSLVWSYVGAAGNAQLAANGLSNPVYDFNNSQLLGSSSALYQYKFNFASAAQFVPTAGSIYWIVVQAQTASGQTFAWASSVDKYNDRGVFGSSSSFGSTRVVFNPLSYPSIAGIEPDQYGRSIDLAFTIVPEPSSMAVLGLGLAALAAFRRKK